MFIRPHPNPLPDKGEGTTILISLKTPVLSTLSVVEGSAVKQLPDKRQILRLRSGWTFIGKNNNPYFRELYYFFWYNA